MKYNLSVVIAAIALLFAANTAPAQTAAGPASNARTIRISATGEVTAIPDIARISAGVVTEAPAAKDALAANSATTAKVIAALKSAGIAAKDIQTSSITVSPRYSSYRASKPQTLIGFRVLNQVRFTHHKITALGDVLDKLVQSGANQISGISFAVSDAEKLLDAARKNAMEKAFRRAELYASAARAKLGDVLQINENVRAQPSPYPRVRSSASAAPVPVEVGSQTLSVSVNVTFALN